MFYSKVRRIFLLSLLQNILWLVLFPVTSLGMEHKTKLNYCIVYWLGRDFWSVRMYVYICVCFSQLVDFHKGSKDYILTLKLCVFPI